ncbi:MAG: DUF3305 domain-containing protein [Rhodanobacter sp.]
MADTAPDDRYCVVSVLLERGAARGPWGQSRWQVVGIVPDSPGPPMQGPTCSVAHDDETTRVYLWSGLCLRLSPVSCDDYVLNLRSERPLLFVICQSDADGELRPVTVSADQQDGVDALEVDGTVFEVDMPPVIASWIAEWVPKFWKPSQRKGRKWQKLQEEWPT